MLAPDEFRWMYADDNPSPLGKRGAALVGAGFNNTSGSMGFTEHQPPSRTFVRGFLSDEIDVACLEVTQDSKTLSSITSQSALLKMEIAQRLVQERAEQTDGKLCIFLGHSFQALLDSRLRQLHGGSPMTTSIYLAPPHRLQNPWHSIAQIARSSMMSSAVKHLPVPCWNPHMFSRNPMDGYGAHKVMPGQSFLALFGVYNDVHDNDSIPDTDSIAFLLDRDDELVNVKKTTRMLRRKKGRRREKVRQFFRLVRRKIRGKRYHHNVVSGETIGEEWPNVAQWVRRTLGIDDSPEVARYT